MALTPQQDRINRAVDDLLSRAEQIEFQASLEADHEQAALYARLRDVDALLRHPPLAMPAPDFTAKVMARIAAEEHRDYAPQARTTRTLARVGMLAAFILIPVLVLLAVAVPVMAQPGVFMALFQQFVGSLGIVSAWLQGVQLFLGDLIAAYPMAPALAVTTIPIAMVWAWLVWYLLQRNRPETIVIPVQVLS
jgi:anti-sigma factor RsiW